MLIALHKNARTTPAVRAEIAASNEPASVLAQRFGITEQTVYKWKKRDVFADRSHTAHRLQTVLTPAQETVVVHLRRTLLLPLDDLLAVTREFLSPDVSRSGLDRCLRRHGAGNLNALKPQEPAVAHKAFKSYEPGYVHMDVKYLPQMQDESSRRYLFVAIDRATRWVFVQLKSNKTAASAQAFLKALHKACPIRINKLLTDNGKEFTDRLFASREREPSGNHEFDQLCQELGIEHRLTKPRTPRTNGMVERFNGRIADVLKTHRFNSREDMEQTLLRYVALYNHQLPQSALKSKTPMQAMKEWHQTHPHLFHKRPYDRPGCDNYIVYLVREDFRGIHLSINQGVTSARKQYGAEAKRALRVRAADFLARLGPLADGLLTGDLDLASGGSANLSSYYEAGNVCSIYYPREELPNDNVLEADLRRFVDLYFVLVSREPELFERAEAEEDESNLGEEDLRKLREHKRVERNRKLAHRAKLAHGYTCKACGFDFEAKYGSIGRNFIEAHHLLPIADFKGQKLTLDAKSDFTVLCANCHRMIHRTALVHSAEEFRAKYII